MDYKKNIEGADEMTTEELFERLNDKERIQLLFDQMENTYGLLFQQEQRIDHLVKQRKIDFSIIEMLLENDAWYSKQLGGHGQKPELLNSPSIVEAFKKRNDEEEFVAKKKIEFYTKKEYCKDFDVSTKTFERLKKKGEIPVSTVLGSDYVLKEAMLERLKMNQ